MRHSYPPQQYAPPRRRRSHDWFRLYDLPVELRLLVIELSLPPVNDVSMHWPAPIPAMLRVSKQFNADTKMVMRRWSPVHYVPDPDYLDSVPHPGAVKVETICLSIFHDARIGVLRSGPYTQTPAEDHSDLVSTWMTHVHQLPRFDTVRSIAIDATPAPGWLRYDKPAWLPSIVNDKSVSDRFIFEHIAVIADLMTTIAGFYNSLNHTINIELSGLYGHRSSLFPGYVQHRCERMDLDIPFTGSIIPEPRHHHSPTMTIERAISELYSTRSIPPDRYRRLKPQIVNDRRRLLQYDYTPTSEFLFEQCFLEDESWTMYHLERLTDFVLSDDEDDDRDRRSRKKYMDVHIADFAHGSFVCSLAKDLDLNTTPRSSWRRKEIRVFRKSGRRRMRVLNREGSSSLFSLLLMSAAVMLFVGVLNSDSRRRRGQV